MSSQVVATFVAFGSGLLFGSGLVLGGMTDPTKVLGFLDFTGQFDPSLLFVMVGAIGVHAVAYRFIRRRAAPWLSPRFQLPTRQDVDVKLLGGAALFGLGWGLAGYCPGPSLTSLPSLSASAWIFVLTMALGMYVGAKLERKEPRQNGQLSRTERATPDGESTA